MRFGIPASICLARPSRPVALPMTRTLQHAAFVLPVLLAGILAVFPLHNDDAGFHLATGRTIQQLGHVPLSNPFSYAQDGAVWVQHQWLPALGMAMLVNLGGIKALVLAKACAVMAAFGLAAWTMACGRVPASAACVWLVLGVSASAFRFYERPYLASILALALVTLGLWRWWQTGWRPGLWLAALTPVLAVHLHAGALDGLLVWLAALGAALLEGRTTGAWQRARAVAGALAATLVAVAAGLALFAPSGLGVLGLPFSFAGNDYWRVHLAEFRPLRLGREALLQWPLVIATAAATLWALRTRQVFGALLLAGFGFLALRHVRMVWPLAVVAMPIGAELTAPWALRLRRPWLLPALALALACSATLEQQAQFGLGLGADGINPQRHPLALIHRAARLPGQAFVSDGFAGTWLWQAFSLPAQHQVLVHNCLECYREETYRNVYQRLRYGESDWPQIVARYGIRTFLLKYTTAGERALQQGRPNIRQQLFASADWVLVDFDDAGEIFTARSSLPAHEATLDGFPVDPDSGVPRAGAAAAEVTAALRAHAGAHPATTRALALLLPQLRRTGHGAEASEVGRELGRRAGR